MLIFAHESGSSSANPVLVIPLILITAFLLLWVLVNLLDKPLKDPDRPASEAKKEKSHGRQNL